MKAYMSLSTKGYKILKKDDLDFKMFKLALHLLKINFKEVNLITDNFGAEYLKELQFSNVSTELEDIIPDSYRIMWILSKIYTYKIAAKRGDPFIHIDNDIFLFDRLKQEFLYNPVFAQHQEENVWSFYHADEFYNAIPNKYYFNDLKINHAANTGIFGGTDLEFIYFYATEALKCALDSENKSAICSTSFTKSFNPACMIEQYYLNLLAEIKNKKVTYLLDNNNLQNDAYKYKFTHVWNGKTEMFIEINNKIDQLLYYYNL